MRQSVRRQFLPLLLVASVVTGWGCNTAATSALTTTTPTAVTTTDVFTGTLNMNGAASYSFVTQAAGSVVATLISLGPDSSLSVGISLGTWNGTGCSIQTGIFNDVAPQGSILTGNVGGAGTLCVRLYDIGKITDPLAFTVNVVHP